MDNLNNNNIEPVDGSTVVRKSKAGKILKENGYKISNKNVDAFVSLKDINKIYPNGVQAVYDFNIDIEEHDFIVLVGPSGCGKSTTLRMVAGLEDITSGHLFIDKVSSNYTPSKDRDISMVFQNYALYPQMTVFDNIAFPLRIRKFRRVVESVVLKSWTQVLEVLENRAKDFIIAVNDAKNKSLNFGTVIEYVATRLKICDAAAKKLFSFKINKLIDLEVVNPETGLTLKEQIKLFAENEIAKEKQNLAKRGLEYDEQFRILKNGKLQYEMKKMTKEEIRAKVFEAAEILDLGPYLDRRPKELSGGQMQRVALGRAIVRNAKLFLMDEPLSNLDAKLRVQMRSEIVRIHEQIGATTIYVTHDQTEAMTMATKIAVMSKGWVQQIGTPQDIYYNPKNRFVATFIGSPAMNIFDAEYNKGTVTFADGYQVKLPRGFITRHNKFYEEKVADLERMLATADFIKMHALKVVDKVAFQLDAQLDSAGIFKVLNEVLVAANNVECGETLHNLLAPYAKEKAELLVKEIAAAKAINAKEKLLEIRNIVKDINDEHGIKALELINGLIGNKFGAVDSENYSLPTYFDYLKAVKAAIAAVEALEGHGNKALLAKLESLYIADQLAKDDKQWLLEIRRPLLTFEKIPSADIGKLHNAQTFSKDVIEIDDTLYYQKPKKQKKEATVKVNLNSVEVEFVNNLYEVAVNLLAKYKQALTGKHNIQVGVRPENIYLNNEFDGEDKTDSFKINADVVELLGSELLIHSNWNGTEMISKISTGTLIKPHSEVELTFDRNKIYIFDESCGDTI